jgi:uncharacterized protein (PEP-CTERM system associated)
LVSPAVNAGQWDITPRLSLAQIYTDNVDLEPEDEQDAYITEISPSISVNGRGGRFQANIDYRMQNFFSSEDNFSPSTSHQLNANTNTEFARNLFFLDADARAGQAIIDSSGRQSRNNYTNNSNRTDFLSGSISPYLTPHFGTYADATLRYTHDRVLYSKGDASDSRTNRFQADIVNGRRFSLLSWAGNYSYRKESRDSGSASDVTYENASGNARFRLTRYFSLLGQAGWTNDDFQSSEDFDNGTYWAVGGFWQSSRFYSLQALTGNNLTTATLGLFPTRRTEFTINYRDREVGTNPGEVWTFRFSHYTRRSTWSASYTEDTTTSQQRQLEEQEGFLLIDPETGEPNPDPQPGDVVVIAPLGPTTTLSDEVEERKRGQGTVGFNTGKSGLRATVFYEERKFLESLDEEESRGIRGSWNWRFAPRTSSTLTASFERTTNDRDDRDESGDNDNWYVEASVRHRLATDLNGSLTYRFERQDSDDGRNDYDENSLIARLTATF